jgi:hypothetical protein
LIPLMARQMNAPSIVIEMSNPKSFAFKIHFGEALFEHLACGTEAIQWCEFTEASRRHSLWLDTLEHTQN